MKPILSFCLALLLTACHTTRIYVVRHAEKADASVDPPLSAAGQQRAEALRAKLEPAALDAAFATQYQRTLETATPTAQAQRIVVRRYLANAGQPLMDSLSRVKRKQFLVVGHSNTLLPMLQAIGLQPGMNEMADTDYDNLFVVTIRWFLGRHLHLKADTYGRATP